MDLLQTGSADDQTFLLIRLPKETVARHLKGESHVGTVHLSEAGYAEFQDNQSQRVYTLMRNSVPKQLNGGSQRSKLNNNSQPVADDESDLFKISLQKDEAVHLGKVKLSTLLAVPKGDETDVSAVFG